MLTDNTFGDKDVPLNVQFAPHEWAIIVLLKDVRDKLIKPKLDKWESALELHSAHSENIPFTTEQVVLLKNISAAFLNLHAMLRAEGEDREEKVCPVLSLSQDQLDKIELILSLEKNQLEKNVLMLNKGATKRPIVTILDLLREKGHLLFNSYYYTAINAFGESSLVPIIPGYHPNQEYDNILPFFYNNQLPFRVDPKHIATYASQVLPCSGGITPHYFDLVSTGKRAERTFQIPYFLADLRILLKRGDMIQGHLSAFGVILGGVISGQIEINHGAFVLTCLIPDAFEDSEVKTLNGINDDFYKLGILAAFEQEPILSMTGIRIDPVENKFLKEIGDTSQLIDQVKSGLTNTFLDTKNSMLGFKVHFNSQREDVDEEKGLVAIAVDMEGIYRFLKSIFPSGPWLDRELVCHERRPYPIKIMEARSLYHLCKYLNKLRQPGRDDLSHLIREFPAFLEAFTMLLPELSTVPAPEEQVLSLHDCILPFQIKNKDYSLLIVKAPNSSLVEDIGPLRDILEHICSDDRQQMPDGENSVLEEAQEKWVTYQYRKYVKRGKTKDRESDDISYVLYKSLNEYIDASKGIRAVMLLKKRKTYLPLSILFMNGEGEVERDINLRDCYLSYPSFWLFEKLNHIFQDDVIFIHSFDDSALPRSIVKGFLCDKSNGHVYPEVKVTLGMREEEVIHNINKGVIRALTYYGMRVSCWQKSDAFEGVIIEIQNKQFSVTRTINQLTEAYRHYLRYIMRSAHEIESFRTIFDPYGTITSISIDCDPVTRMTTHVLSFDNDYSLIAKWTPVETNELRLCCLEDSRIREALRQNTAFWKNKDEDIVCSCQQNPDFGSLFEENSGQNSETLSEAQECSTLHCRIQPIRINAGIDKGAKEFEFGRNEKRHICEIARGIKTMEDNNMIAQDRERANLLPQVSHAMGTELSALAGALAMSSQKLKNPESIRLVRIYGAVKRSMQTNNIMTLNELEEIVSEKEKLLRAELTADENELLSLLVDSRNSDNHEDYFRALATAFSNQFGLSDVRNLLLAILFRTESARDKNRAVLRLGSQEAKITFSPSGEYDIEECLYSAIITALQHFYSLTILRPASLFEAKDFVEMAYEDAFRYYWGENTKPEELKEEIELWSTIMLYAKKQNYKQNFKYWESNYANLMYKLHTPFINFNISNMPYLRYSGGVGNLLLNIGFQEIILNYLKYAGVIFDGDQKIVRISITSEASEKNDGLKMFRAEAKLRSEDDAAFKRDGKGGQLIDTVLQDVLGLRRPANGQYRFIENESFVIYGEGSA